MALDAPAEARMPFEQEKLVLVSASFAFARSQAAGV